MVAALCIAAIITRMIPRLRWMSGYLIGGTIGTLPGFLIANAIVTLAGLLPVWISEQFAFSEWQRQACAILTMLGFDDRSVCGIRRRSAYWDSLVGLWFVASAGRNSLRRGINS